MAQKLVRDKIPELMRATGKTPRYRLLERPERMGWLLRKLREETDEVIEDTSMEECADLYEVLLAIVGELGCSIEELAAAAQQKSQARGAFNDGILLETN